MRCCFSKLSHLSEYDSNEDKERLFDMVPSYCEMVIN